MTWDNQIISTYELRNSQREYFGLDPIEKNWDKVELKGDTYRTASTLYFDGDIIKRHIVSTESKYFETQYHEITRDRTILLPKTTKGKEKKLTGSVLEQRTPHGPYLSIYDGHMRIGHHNTQATFYSTRWERVSQKSSVSEMISEFIAESPLNHMEAIKAFKNARRKHVKFKCGDYFCFKLDRINYGFGRILLDIGKLRKKGMLPRENRMSSIMMLPVVIELFAFKSRDKNVPIDILDRQPKLPSDIMADNQFTYGEYEVIGHRPLKDEEFDFPISYGSRSKKAIVFLQWGMIQRELPYGKYSKYLTDEDIPPFEFYAIGFRPHYGNIDVTKTMENNGIFDFDNTVNYIGKRDLRSPKQREMKNELFKVFGLDPNKSYAENCDLTGTPRTTEIIKRLEAK